MDNNFLTKSDFLLFLEAPRHLWAEKHDLIDKIPSVLDINIMRQGYEVVDLLRREESTLRALSTHLLLVVKRSTSNPHPIP
jgi:hypothetical protein